MPAEPLLHLVRRLPLQDVIDERGRLTAVEAEQHIPFAIQRIFYVHQVRPREDRAGHAHMDTDQVAIAITGQFQVVVEDGLDAQSFLLDRPDEGLYLPRQAFVRLREFSPGAVCLVLANTHYDRSRSLRTWEDYLQYRGLG